VTHTWAWISTATTQIVKAMWPENNVYDYYKCDLYRAQIFSLEGWPVY